MPEKMARHVYTELEREVAHIRAAKQGAVLTIRDSQNRDAHLPPDIWPVPLGQLTTEDLGHVRLDEMELYASGETFGPYIIEDSEETRAALAKRLGTG